MSRFDTTGNLPSSNRNAKSRVALALVAARVGSAVGRGDGETTSFRRNSASRDRADTSIFRWDLRSFCLIYDI
jgi:hypothetical protein